MTSSSEAAPSARVGNAFSQQPKTDDLWEITPAADDETVSLSWTEY
jgi:hypothetical protein